MTEPTKLGKYEIRRELGRGAMGVVYEAFDPMIERVVALKTIRRDQLEGTEAQEIMTRFQREAKAAGRLTHPHIVAVYDYGEDNGTAFIAMEFVRGRSLKDYFDKGERFPIAQTARIMGQLLDALGFASKNGIVHRDIKPANIILLEDGTVKVADFGIARILSSEFTQAGQVLGTPSYMSPEQFMGQTVDGRSDLFSAGVVLYQLLTGERPFTGAATTIMHKVLKEDPLPPSTLNVQVPKPFDAVIRKAMGKRPDDRFQTAQAFAAAINTAAENRMPEGIEIAPEATMVAGGDATFVTLEATQKAPATAPAERTAVTSRPAAQAPAAAMPTGDSAAAARKGGSRNAVVLAVVAGLCFAVAAGAWWLQSRDKPASGNTGTPVAPSVAGAPAAPAAQAPGPDAAALPQAGPDTMTFSAVGLADPSDQQFKADPNAAAAAARADGRRQLVEKALALYVDGASLARNYALVQEKLLARSNDFVANVVNEAAPVVGKDGLMQVSTTGTVRVREVQKALNQMSREERVEFIRVNGDPKISVTMTVRDEGSNAVYPSQMAENVVKERIKTFGFRTWADDGKAAGTTAKGGADFAVIGEAAMRKLSAKLAASGLTIDKYMLTSWTVKAVDKATGEEIYFNNKLPKNIGSQATPEQALADIGGKIADEFSRDFFLQHFVPGGRPAKVRFEGLPDKMAEQALAREIPGLPLIAVAVPQGAGRIDVLVAGGNGPVNELVAAAILAPLNAKLGATCFTLGATAGEEVTVRFDPKCKDAATLARFDSYPPAALYASPPARRAAVVKNPETVKKLSI